MCIGPLKRICNWGPLTALAIIKIITLTAIHCCRQQWGPNKFPLFDIPFLMFLLFSSLTLYYFIGSIYEGPGYLPRNWVPEKINYCQFLQFCNICQGYKAPRCHHCRKCGQCVLKMDHHCPWINNCVGHRNHGFFTAFLTSAVAGCSISTYIMINWLIIVLSSPRLPFPSPTLFCMIIVLLSIGLSIGVIIAVGMLLYFQIVAIVKNQTGIEAWIVEKANYRRQGTGESFIYPYSKDVMFNIRQVISWNCLPNGDGIQWPVVQGCDEYTLTREQIAQKLEKRRRSRRYRVIAKVSGSWLPISHGLKVLCSPPCTDEPRIKLDIDDTVLVTRWRNNWLFGEKENVRLVKDGKDTRIRGWFPRPSVIEVIEKEYEFEDFEFSAQSTPIKKDEELKQRKHQKNGNNLLSKRSQ